MSTSFTMRAFVATAVISLAYVCSVLADGHGPAIGVLAALTFCATGVSIGLAAHRPAILALPWIAAVAVTATTLVVAAASGQRIEAVLFAATSGVAYGVFALAMTAFMAGGLALGRFMQRLRRRNKEVPTGR